MPSPIMNPESYTDTFASARGKNSPLMKISIAIVAGIGQRLVGSGLVVHSRHRTPSRSTSYPESVGTVRRVA